MLARLFFETQMKEADKVPGLWSVYSGTVSPLNMGTMTAESILSKNPNRSGMTLKNLGPGKLLYSSEPFNVNEAQTNVKTMSGIIRIGVLTSGTNVSIPTSGAVYAACDSTTACKITIVETMFRVRLRNETGSGTQWHGRTLRNDIDKLVKDFV